MIRLFRHFVDPSAAEMVAETLASSCIGQGPKVDQFEHALEPWIGPNVTVNSGTSALWLAYDLAGIKEGDYVISTPMTCLATNIPLAHIGCTILWADVDPKTGLIDPASVRQLLKNYDKVRAIVCVDYAGSVCDIESLWLYSNQYEAFLIDDAAHSFGACRESGNKWYWANFHCYSFQAIKHLTTGDGGAITMRGDQTEARLKRWFGLDRTKGDFRCDQTVTLKGYKFHMTDIAATLGLANLAHVGERIALHRKHAAAYDAAGLGKTPPGSSSWMYNVLVPDRESFISEMAKRGIECARTHNRNDRHPIFRAPEQHLPGVTEFNDHQCSVPVGWWLSDEDVAHIIKSATEVLGL
jgi:dTDP-4-amino-4,6-dideoxygalactose transaminase